VLAVAETEEADFVAFEEFFDDNLLLSRAKECAGEKPFCSLGGDGSRRTDDDTLAGGEAIGFDDDGRMEDFEGLDDLACGSADGVFGSGDAVALEEALGESFAGFKHGGGTRGTEDAKAALLELIDDTERKREFGTNDSEVRTLGFREADHGVEVFEIERNAAGDLSHAAVAWGANDLRNARAARDGPGESVFATAGAEDQYFHRAEPFVM